MPIFPNQPQRRPMGHGKTRPQRSRPQPFRNRKTPEKKSTSAADMVARIPEHINKFAAHAGRIREGVNMLRQVKAIISIFKS
ncbi:hypothetical protein [Peribacillus sp. SCS-155]|uniref:hypothetical protein n=1 Tax=Peribacillus sedimenti TaxID=3115297 RepID=UPI0039064DEA